MTSPNLPAQTSRHELRVSDSEREHQAAELGRHHADGRLDTVELATRLELTYAARTQGDLEALLTDLPGLPHPGPTPVSQRHRRPPPVVVGLVALATAGFVIAFLFGVQHALAHARGAWSDHEVWSLWWLVALAWWATRSLRRRHGLPRT